MGFRFETNETVADGLKRIVLEQVDKAIAEIDDEKLPRSEAVHQVRKRCKKIRGALRLVRPVFGGCYRAENALFRNASRQLATLRDASALVDTFDAVIDAFRNQVDVRRFAPLRRRLVRHRQQVRQEQEAHSSRLQKVRQQMHEARKRVSHWTLTAEGFPAIKGGLLKTYARGRKASRLAYEHPSAETFHDWRKRAKYHRYHIRLLRNLWRPVMQRLRRELIELSDRLGDDHDLAVLRTTLLNEPRPFARGRDLQVVVGLIDRRSAELRAAARHLGARVYAEKPKQLGRRFRSYWKAWRSNRGQHSGRTRLRSARIAA